MTRAPLPSSVAVVALSGVLLAGCGSSGDDATTTTATAATTTAEATATTTSAAGTTTSVDATTTTLDDATGEQLTAEGVVIAVDGNLEAVASFTVRLADGSDLTFAPNDDARFDGGPISHIRDHLTSGAPVRVDYVVLSDGTNLALSVGDA